MFILNLNNKIPVRMRVCCRLSLADKLKLFSGKKSSGKSVDSGVKSRRHLPRFQTQVIPYAIKW